MIQTANSLEKILMLGKIEGKRRRGQQRIKWLNSITNSMDMNLSKLCEIVKDKGTRTARHYVPLLSGAIHVPYLMAIRLSVK